MQNAGGLLCEGSKVTYFFLNYNTVLMSDFVFYKYIAYILLAAIFLL